MTVSASRTIKSAQRVLEIFEYFDQDRRHATVMSMSRTLDYPQSSTSELLRCLTRLGYLHYNRFRRTYSPTTRVALLGAWVTPSLFRGGPVLSGIDEIAELTSETVMLSTANNYVVQHLYVIHGSGEHAIDVHGGDTQPLLHSVEGKLLLSSYQNDHIRSAVHRLNADEEDTARHVRFADTITELAALRERGWAIETGTAGGTGSVAVLLPLMRHRDRLIISVQARSEAIEESGQDILAMLMDRREKISALSSVDGDEADCRNGVPLTKPIKVLDYRRQFA